MHVVKLIGFARGVLVITSKSIKIMIFYFSSEILYDSAF